MRQDLIPSPVEAVAVVALPYRLPRTEMRWQMPPRNPGPIPVDDSLRRQPKVIERPTVLTRGIRHQRRNELPLGIR